MCLEPHLLLPEKMAPRRASATELFPVDRARGCQQHAAKHGVGTLLHKSLVKGVCMITSMHVLRQADGGWPTDWLVSQSREWPKFTLPHFWIWFRWLESGCAFDRRRNQLNHAYLMTVSPRSGMAC